MLIVIELPDIEAGGKHTVQFQGKGKGKSKGKVKVKVHPRTGHEGP